MLAGDRLKGSKEATCKARIRKKNRLKSWCWIFGFWYPGFMSDTTFHNFCSPFRKAGGLRTIALHVPPYPCRKSTPVWRLCKQASVTIAKACLVFSHLVFLGATCWQQPLFDIEPNTSTWQARCVHPVMGFFKDCAHQVPGCSDEVIHEEEQKLSINEQWLRQTHWTIYVYYIYTV